MRGGNRDPLTVWHEVGDESKQSIEHGVCQLGIERRHGSGECFDALFFVSNDARCLRRGFTNMNANATSTHHRGFGSKQMVFGAEQMISFVFSDTLVVSRMFQCFERWPIW